tara:strand:+ start:283 stop:1335 length:1053 start_codon:yes stop_codon:yes gene_type:complete
MAYTTVNKSSEHFTPESYTGSGSTQSITGLDFQPDWVWIKRRSSQRGHTVFDAVRGATYGVYPNETGAESVGATSLTAFTSDGFTLGTDDRVSGSGHTYASWNWKGGGTAVSNTNGSTTTSVSANPTSGFSIVKYTGTGSVATLGHGLSTAPSTVFIKRLNVGDWIVGSNGMTSWNYVNSLNTQSAQADQVNQFNGTAPTTSVVTLGTEGQTNQSGIGFIMYCFSDIRGFSKSGSYDGNGNADGPFIYTGFKPSFVMMKQMNSSGQGWCMKTAKFNNAINGNVNNYFLQANQDNSENTSTDSSFGIDMYSNGFKIKTADGIMNINAATYWYMAFAEAPLVGTNNVPANAR